MKIRSVVAKVLFALAIPFVFLGLIDPLEGGVSLVVALGIYAIAFIVLRRKPAKTLWIPFLLSILIGAATLGFAVLNLEFSNKPEPLPGPVIYALWAYRLAVAATLVGAIVTLIQSFRSNQK